MSGLTRHSLLIRTADVEISFLKCLSRLVQYFASKKNQLLQNRLCGVMRSAHLAVELSYALLMEVSQANFS
jgi:hypothetical protein